MTKLDSQSGGLGSIPAPLPTNLFFVLGLAGLKFSSITLNRQLVVYSHMFCFVVVVFFYPVTLYLSYLFLITIYIRNSCNYRSGIYSNKRHGTYLKH